MLVSPLRRLLGPSTRRPAPRRTAQLQLESLEQRVTPALVLALGMNEGAGTAVTDASGSGNSGTLVNATWNSTGKYGKALSFNGTSARVTIPDAASLHLTTGMTLEAWVKPTTVTSAWRDVIYKANDNYYMMATTTNTSKPCGGMIVNGSNVEAFGTKLSTTAWTHLAVTYDGAAVRLFVNGAQVSSVAKTGPITISNNPLTLGSDPVYGQFYSGLIDEVRVYDSALTVAQITTDMNTPIASDTIAPTVSVTAPANGTTVGNTVSVTASASDNVAVAGVQFYLDGAALGSEVTVAPYAVSWNTWGASNGTHTLTAKARDAVGNLGTSATVQVTVSNLDTTPPAVDLTSPADAAYLSGSVAVTATATDNVGVEGVQFYLDGTALSSEDTSSPYSVSWDTATAARGTHTLTAVARDLAGNLTTSAARTVNVVPRLTITAPTNNATLNSPTVNVTYTTSGDMTGVAHVHFILDSNPEVTDETVDGTFQFTNVAEGTHVLTGYLVHAAPQESGSGQITFTVQYPESTPPSVNLTAPTDGAFVTGTVQVSANASDNVAVAGVQFLLDEAALGTEDTTAPYGYSWNTSSVSTGSHVLTARARDTSGNTTVSSPITVTVTNPNDPSQVGQWGSVMSWPLVAVNVVLLKTGKILMWDGGPTCIGASSARLWNPADNTFKAVPLPDPNNTKDLFCAGQSVLSDGRVLVVAGHECNDPNWTGVVMSNIFDPVTETWTVGPNMAYRRYYPTATTLADGRVLTTSGSDVTDKTYVPIPEVYDPVTNVWTKLSNASLTISNYPYVFVLPNGKVLVAGSDESKMATYTLDVATQTWQVVDSRILDGGSAVMYLPGKVMKTGSSYIVGNLGTETGLPSAATTYVLDMTQGSPTWQQTTSMANPRTHLNLTILPDDSVLATGGSTDLSGIVPANGVLSTELWSPNSKTWTTLASQQNPRMYHSTALLLPDGRVLSAGGGHNYINTADYFDAQIYSPPYLFKGSRPVITSSPTNLAYGSSFFVETPDGANIASVALIRNGSVTHSINMDQRYIPLSFTQTSGGLTVQAPPDANTAPPGEYMLFIVNSNGVPAVAPFVRFPAAYEDLQPPTAPGNLVAAGGVGTAALTWSAATDNVGVVRYNIYRSTTTGFTPSSANRVGQSATTTFTDSGLTAGTYYYRVTAEDAAGNVGPASNEASAIVTSDTSPPSVTLTNPAGGAVVTGSITLGATATDDIGVAGVQFLIDGAALGGEDPSAPYTATWDSALFTNGTHTVTARARDTGGNTTDATVTVTVSNTSGLVLALGMNEGSGTAVTDVSGRANNGTLANTAWNAAGKYGRALSFNGTSSRVTILDSASLRLTTGMTLEAWVKPTTITSAWRDLIYKGDDNYYLNASSTNSSRPVGGVIAGGVYGEAIGTATLSTTTWTHLAATYDGAAVRLYVNGTQVASVARTGSITTSANPLTLGSDAIYGQFYSGLMDEVRVYNRPLSAAEIQTDMNTPIGSSVYFAGAAAAGTGVGTLSPVAVRPVFDEALARWQAVLGSPAAVRQLHGTRIEIRDLPGNLLGLAAPGVIYLDVNAAGHGWFVDKTPRNDSEFRTGSATTAASGRVDLLTVLAHEAGHLLGFADDGTADLVKGSVMATALGSGIRRVNFQGIESPTVPRRSGGQPAGFAAVDAFWALYSQTKRPGVSVSS